MGIHLRAYKNGETGGAATHKGIWYQALWCAFQAASTQIETSETGGVKLILEPFGGDAWLEQPGHRRVVQLKTAYRGTWSLKEVVEDVLPDLYRAVELRKTGKVTYEFVTEGRLGDWKPVLKFFKSLGERFPQDALDESLSAAYEALDDHCAMKFAGSSGTFWKGTRTERKVFDRILEHLHKKELAANEKASIKQTRRKTWQLLAHFKFEGDVHDDEVRRKLDDYLLTVVEHREKLASIRDAMVGYLIDRSRKSRATITPAELFHRHGLKNVVQVGCSTLLRERSREQVKRRAQLLMYYPEWDVRKSDDSVSHKLLSLPPITAVTGESGHGKTWRLCDEVLRSDGTAVVLLNSTGDMHGDLQNAADEVWRTALGHDGQLNLQRLSARRADVLEIAQDQPWLLVALDDLKNVDQANALLTEPLEEWGVRVIVTCDNAIAEVFEQYRCQKPERVQVLRVGPFSTSERDTYIQRRLGDTWVDIPRVVRGLICSPLLAATYCDIASEQHGWQPQNEYELIERNWLRLTKGKIAPHCRDELRLRRLAATILDGEPYPWKVGSLDDAGIDEEAVHRMGKCGWIRINTDGYYEFSHSRFLNFAVAKYLAEGHRDKQIEDTELAERFALIMDVRKQYSGPYLGYVPMDWFFLRCRDNKDGAGALSVLRLLCDKLDHHSKEILHRDLLPTLGAAAPPLLWDSFVNIAEKGTAWGLSSVIDGLASLPIEQLKPRIIELLGESSPLLQRAALRLLCRCPVPEALDAVWNLHKQMQDDSARFLTADEVERGRPEAAARSLYNIGFDALRGCTRLKPEWLAEAIRCAAPDVEPVHDLAYLTARLNDDGNTWRIRKEDLFTMVAHDKRRSLALNIGIWHDVSKADWLEEVVNVNQDFLGAAALEALAQIDPFRAVRNLNRLPSDQWCFKGRFLSRLFASVPAETNEELRRNILAAEDRMFAFLVYRGNENSMDVNTFNILLDTFEVEVTKILEEAASFGLSKVRDKCIRFSTLLEMLAKMGRGVFLDELIARKGSALENRLVDLLIDVFRPRQWAVYDGFPRDSALELLRRMGGSGHQRVVNVFLDADNQYGKLDAIWETFANPNQETLQKLRRIVTSDVLWDDDFPVLQQEAMKALASAGDIVGIIEGAMNLGLKIPRYLEGWLCPQIVGKDEGIQRAMDVMEERNPATLPGALYVLGLLRHSPAMEAILKILKDPPNDEVRIAAVISLGLFGDRANSAVELIKTQIGFEKCRHASHTALWQIETADARRALIASLDERWDPSVAVTLTQFQDTRVAAIDSLVSWIEKEDMRSPRFWIDGGDLVFGMASEDVLGNILRRCLSLAEYVREAALGGEGGLLTFDMKYGAIRALAVIDPNTARLTAKKAMVDCESRDRHIYPPLLYRLDPDEARETFLGMAAKEKNPAVTWAMMLSLQSANAAWLLDKLSDNSTTTRTAACKLSMGAAIDNKDVYDRVTSLLQDPSHSVRNAAEATLERCRRERWTRTLIEQVDRPRTTTSRAWTIFNAILRIAEVGYEGGDWPEWVSRFIESRPVQECPALRRVFMERLNELRKKSLRDAMGEVKKAH